MLREGECLSDVVEFVSVSGVFFGKFFFEVVHGMKCVDEVCGAKAWFVVVKEGKVEAVECD
jgi:hypothetical protein